MTFILLAILPTIATTVAVLITMLVMALYCPKAAPSYPAADWDALDAELEADAGWEALYCQVLGCNRATRCKARRPRPAITLSMTETQAQCGPRGANVGWCRAETSSRRFPDQRGPPPPGGGRDGQPLQADPKKRLLEYV